MNKATIALKKFQAIVIDAQKDAATNEKASTAHVLTLNAHLMSQGYVLSEDFLKAMNTSGR